MTIFPDVLSKSEVKFYREQADNAAASLRTRNFEKVDNEVAMRIENALNGRRLRDEKAASSSLEVPISSYIRNNQKPGLKVSRRFFA